MSATSALPSDTIYFTRISSTDHTGILGVITLLSLVYTVISSGARLWSRCGRYGADDWTLLACMLIGVCQHASIFVALHFGLGKASELLHRNQIEALSHAVYASSMLYIATVCLAKVSIALFIRRIFSNAALLNRTTCNILVAGSAICGVCSMVILRMVCLPSFLYSDRNTCPGQLQRWRAITVLNIVSDLALMIVPAMLVFRVITDRSRKAIVLSAFLTRLPLVAFTVMHLVRTGPTDSFALIEPLVWLQVEVMWSIVTASMPPLKYLFQTHVRIHDVQPSEEDRLEEVKSRRIRNGPQRPRPFSGAHAIPASWRTDPIELQKVIKATRPVSIARISSVGVSTTHGFEQDLEAGVRCHTEWEVRHDPIDLDAESTESEHDEDVKLSSTEHGVWVIEEDEEDK